MSSSDSNYADPNLDLGVLEATPKRKAKILDMVNKIAGLEYYIELMAKLKHAQSSDLGEEISITLTNEEIMSIRGLVWAKISRLQEEIERRDSDKKGVRSCRAGLWLRCDCEIKTKHPYPNKSDRTAPISDDQTPRTYPVAHRTLARSTGSEV
jgi:hypothetical protein